MTKRQEGAAQTRQRLVDTARGLILEKGLESTSVEEITKCCGVSKGTFYTYFKRKEDVVFELSRGMFDEILANAMGEDVPLLKKLRSYVVSFAAYIEKSGLKLAQEWIKNVADPDLCDEGVKKLAKDRGALGTLISSAVEAGELSDSAPVEDLAETVAEALYGQLLCWAIDGGQPGYTCRARKFCDICLEGIFEEYLIAKEGK